VWSAAVTLSNPASKCRSCPGPRAAAAGADLNETTVPAVVATPNPFAQQMPAVLLTNPKPPQHKLRGDLKVRQADEALRNGENAYKAQQTDEARRQFDLAVDLMLEAMDENVADRQDYEDYLDEIVEKIHRHDLAGLGAAATFEPGRFEKAPLEDILQMTFRWIPS